MSTPDGAASPMTFAEAFREATDQRGLSLERLTYHLGRRGHDLSTATLSYWRTGRSVPQRSTSIAALGALEEILRVERGSLAALVPPRPLRGVEPASPAERAERYVRQGDLVSSMIRSLGLGWGSGLEYLCVADRIALRRDGTLDSHRVSQLVRAVRDGVDRFPVWYGHEDDERSYPFITAESNCRVGQVREASIPLVVAELLLPRALNTGEVIAVDFAFGAAGQTTPMLDWNRDYIAPIRESYLEVAFDPQAIPLTVEEILIVGTEQRITAVPVGGEAVYHYRQDFGPGTWGMRWDWGPTGPPQQEGASHRSRLEGTVGPASAEGSDQPS